ncbi:hypothetical protein AB0A69_08080 [Streptomyces sp. NPDC045431]|uniref:hypothetical protein n=1 Tax=Streptomyces sp. NPDC045431 TaxID=3155613 RepID=UPI0033EACEE3
MATQEVQQAAQFAVYIAADNDINGNPRRGWLVHSSLGIPVRFVDEGYAGRQALREAGFDPDSLLATDKIKVPAREYRRLRKEHGK